MVHSQQWYSMTTGRGGSDELDVLTKRDELLGRLCDGAVIKQQLVDELDLPRSTLDRGIRELEAVNLIERRGSQVSATVAGRLALDHFEAFQSGLSDVLAAENVVAPLPLDAPLPREAVTGSEAWLADGPVPHESLEQFHDALADSGRYRTVLPALDDPRHVRLLYEHVITEGKPAELIVSADLLEALRTKFPRRMAAMADTEEFTLLVGDVPPFALAIVEDETTSETTTFVVVFSESGSGVHGVLANETGPARLWAEDCYAERRAGAEERTEALLPDTDGGSVAVDDDGAVRSAVGSSLPSALEREGFVQPGKSYFTAEPVADPTTAWRAGLSLPEVHTGYAIGRTRDDDGPAGESGTVSGALEADLADGSDCVVLGPPGSGKSTVCKQVACEWYEADRGTVLYREGGRGRPFQSVDDLVATVDAADGHTLVVVEDGVRPETDAIFDAIDRLGDREDVSFLLDAREREWHDPAAPPDRADLDVVTMPALDDRDAERLVDHFERTADATVDIPVDRLRETTQDESVSDGTAPDQVLLLLHRLATYADPLAEGGTSLEEAVAALYEDLAEDQTMLDVCVLANALNAAGVEVEAELLYAVAEPEEFSSVDEAIEQLEGRVLFPREDGSYRTVHATWSGAFLAHLLDTDGEAAAGERFGRCVSALLSLADNPEQCDRIAEHRGDGTALAPVIDDPGAWADGTVEAVYALGRERPKLAPLFGDGAGDSVELPDACAAGLTDRRLAWLGEMFVDGGYYEQALGVAERGLAAAPDDSRIACRLMGIKADAWSDRGEFDPAVEAATRQRELATTLDARDLAATAIKRLGGVEMKRGEYDRALAYIQQALASARALDDRTLESRCFDDLGTVVHKQGENDRAREYHERGLAIARELSDRQQEGRCFNNLGRVAHEQCEYETAREYHERGLAVLRAVGGRQGEASTLVDLGLVANEQSDYEAASRYFERGLEVARSIDDRQNEAASLGNLGMVARAQSEYEVAREYHEQNLAIRREIGDRQGIANALGNLSSISSRQGDHEGAREYLQQALEVFRDIGNRRGEAAALGNLGMVTKNLGEYDPAQEYLEEALAIKRDVGTRRSEASSLNSLGVLARECGEYETAREYAEESLAIRRDIGDRRGEATNLVELGALARERGEFRQAREYLDRAQELSKEMDHTPGIANASLEGGRLALTRKDHEAARNRADRARERFAAAGECHEVARCRQLQGRVAAATGDRAGARDHWRAALDTFEEVGAPQDALDTLRLLLEDASDRGDEDARSQWRERLTACVDDAPASAVEVHRAWLEAYLDDRLDDRTADGESTGTGTE
jgi:tetratricopeptide (TPR) repeat protein/predicted transcriptional regulator